jgi:3-hydroxyisobutyrate dehydrogenase-like beta-hydroxyacid dehydrogenase
VLRETILRMGDEGRTRGIAVVDAPVSGGPYVAAAGELLVMVGGEHETVERCVPVFTTFGDPVLHVGPLGSGALAKLVHNTLLAATVAVSSDAMELGTELGLDRDALAQALINGAVSKGSGIGMGTRHHLIASGEVDEAVARTASSWARKDVELTARTAREWGLDAERELIRLGLRAADLLEGPVGPRADRR